MKENVHLSSCESKSTAPVRVSSRIESQKSEPTKYLKFLDPPQNGFRYNRHILWIQSRSWIVNLNEAKKFPKKASVKILGSLCCTRRLLERYGPGCGV